MYFDDLNACYSKSSPVMAFPVQISYQMYLFYAVFDHILVLYIIEYQSETIFGGPHGLLDLLQ
jgi:hypothetical protein